MNMDANIWKRRLALFDAVLELSKEEQAAWLEQVESNEPEHLDAIKKMLAEYDKNHGGDADNTNNDTNNDNKSETPSASLIGVDSNDFALSLDASLNAATTSSTHLHIGLDIGAWRLTQAIGQGGMGEVWLAERRDGLYEGRTAIKFLRTGIGKTEVLERFLRERRLLARLTHPGIARLIDAGTYQDEPYLVMEFIQGTNIMQWAQQHAPRVVDRIEVILKVCRATEYAHNQLVVHRDLKPSNIIVNDEGEPSLLDFGIAKLIEDEDESSDYGTALTRLTGRGYTLGYCAPEQILGEPTGVASDVFSIGVLLFEMMSGALPYKLSKPTKLTKPTHPSRAALEHAIVHTDALSLHSVLDNKSAEKKEINARPSDADKARGDLELIIAKTLRKNPRDRYASVSALANDIEAWLNQRPISIRGEERSYRTRLWFHRHWKLASLASTAVLAIVLGLGFSLWQRNEALAEAARANKVATYLGELIQSASPDNHGGNWPTVLTLLENSEKELPQIFADDPKTHALLLSQLADTNDALNRNAVANEQLLQLQKLIEQTQAKDSDDALEVQKHRVQILRRLERFTEANAIEVVLLPKFIQRYGKNSEEYGRLLMGASSTMSGLGHMDEAKRRLVEGAAILTHLFPNDLAKRVDLVNDSAVLLTKQGMWREAIDTLSTIEKDLPALAKLGGQSVRNSYIMRYNLDAIRIRVGRYDGVEERLQQLVIANNQLYGKDNQQSALVIDKLGSFACETGRFEACVNLRHELVALRQRQIDVNPIDLIEAQLEQLAVEARFEKINHNEVVQQLNRFMVDIPKHFTLANDERADYYRRLASIACQVNVLTIADIALQRGREDIVEHNKNNSENTEIMARLDRVAGLIAYLRGDAKTAVNLLDARFKQYEKVAEGDTPGRASLWLQRALYELDFDTQAAATSLAQARDMFSRSYGHFPAPHWQTLMMYIDARIGKNNANQLRTAEDAVDRAYLRARSTPWRAPQLPSF